MFNALINHLCSQKGAEIIHIIFCVFYVNCGIGKKESKEKKKREYLSVLCTVYPSSVINLNLQGKREREIESLEVIIIHR